MKKNFVLLLRLATAAILLQTLYFKFTGAPESIFIFSTLGAEPYGRWFAGVSELIASVLLVVPATQVFGAVMGVGIMAGAILSHLFVLGFVVQDDGGLLFGLAWAVFVMCLSILIVQRHQLLRLLERWKRANAP